MDTHYLWATLHYRCEEGHPNSVNKFFLCPSQQVADEDLKGYLPNQFSCSLCHNVSSSIEMSFHWLTPEQWSLLGVDERSSAITLLRR
jgi:hypothetical protein